jgi:hypothetical protein
MCYNENVSIGTYILGLVGCYNLYINYELKIEAIFFAWVIQMQLIEYLLWENQTCNDMNKNTTIAGVIVNHTEPIILWISILLLSSKQLPLFVNILMTGFIIITIFYTENYFNNSKNNNNECSLVTPESKPHILWPWNLEKNNNIYYLFFLLCLNVLLINGIDHGYHLALLTTISFTISKLIYEDKKVIGSMWCFIAAFLPWILPYVYQIKFDF